MKINHKKKIMRRAAWLVRVIREAREYIEKIEREKKGREKN